MATVMMTHAVRYPCSCPYREREYHVTGTQDELDVFSHDTGHSLDSSSVASMASPAIHMVCVCSGQQIESFLLPFARAKWVGDIFLCNQRQTTLCHAHPTSHFPGEKRIRGRRDPESHAWMRNQTRNVIYYIKLLPAMTSYKCHVLFLESQIRALSIRLNEWFRGRGLVSVGKLRRR